MTVAEQVEAQRRRELLQIQINQNKITKIDRSIYTKTEKEKADLYKLKNQWKTKLASGYIINKVLLAGSYTQLAK